MNNIRLRLESTHAQVMNKVFSGGEVHVDLSSLPVKVHDYSIRARLQSGDDIMNLIMFANACWRRWPDAKSSVVIPYFPYARQDRQCADGQHFGLAVMVDMLSLLLQDELICYDPHSDVVSELWGMVNHEKPSLSILAQQDIVANYPPLADRIKDTSLQIVSPDKGAVKKSNWLAYKLMGEDNFRAPAFGEKLRDPQTGELTGFDVDTKDFNGRDLLIVDDICDGGGTFLGLAKVLKERNCGKVSLYVTHGIFSRGFEGFSGLIDEIYTTNSFTRDTRPEVHTGNVAQGVKLTTIMV